MAAATTIAMDAMAAAAVSSAAGVAMLAALHAIILF